MTLEYSARGRGCLKKETMLLDNERSVKKFSEKHCKMMKEDFDFVRKTVILRKRSVFPRVRI